jgi:ribose 5-phosphate isomerase A
LKAVPGVVEHGLFLGLADLAIVASAQGIVLLDADGDDLSTA